MHEPTRLAFAALVLTTSLAAPALAGTEVVETVVHDTTTRVDLTLNDQTVLCSSADYSGLFLKVLIPELAGITLLDHQNLGAGAPCVAAGSCRPGNRPEDILDASYPTERVAIRVKAIRIDYIDAEADTCTTVLSERVDLTIRGIDFAHERYADLGTRLASDCGVAPVVAGTGSDTKSDHYGPASVEEPASGGCSTSSSSGGLFGLALVGLVLARRRRATRS